MVKRIFCLVISTVLLLSLTACGKGDDAKSSLSSSSLPSEEPGEYEHLRGTSFVYYTWKDPWLSETPGYEEAMEEKYGIKMDAWIVGQGDYVKTVRAEMASGKQADLLYGKDNFPEILTVLQPLENSGIDLTDPTFCRPLLEATTVNGKPYLADRFENGDKHYSVCVYNKELFEEAGIPTPKDYFDKGEWTFERFIYSAEKISSMNKDYMGAGILSEFGPNLFGDRIISYKDGVFSASVPERFREVSKTLYELKQQGVVKLDRGGFGDGKQGMALTSTYGLLRTGYFTQIHPDRLGVALPPKYDMESEHIVTSPIVGWGIAKNAQNPEAAGLFLKEFLDIAHGEHETRFHNDEVREFFETMVEEYYDNVVYVYERDVMLESRINVDCLWNWNTTDPDEYLDDVQNDLDAVCDEANRIIGELP